MEIGFKKREMKFPTIELNSEDEKHNYLRTEEDEPKTIDKTSQNFFQLMYNIHHKKNIEAPKKEESLVPYFEENNSESEEIICTINSNINSKHMREDNSIPIYIDSELEDTNLKNMNKNNLNKKLTQEESDNNEEKKEKPKLRLNNEGEESVDFDSEEEKYLEKHLRMMSREEVQELRRKRAIQLQKEEEEEKKKKEEEEKKEKEEEEKKEKEEEEKKKKEEKEKKEKEEEEKKEKDDKKTPTKKSKSKSKIKKKSFIKSILSRKVRSRSKNKQKSNPKKLEEKKKDKEENLDLDEKKIEKFNEEDYKSVLKNITRYVDLALAKPEYKLFENLKNKNEVEPEKMGYIYSEESECQDNMIFSLKKFV